MPVQTLSYLPSVTMENQTFVEKFKKKEFKLQDSMEFYKKQDILPSSSPKQEFEQETLLVGTDEEDEGNQNEEEAPIVRRLSVCKWFDANDSDSQSESEEGAIQVADLTDELEGECELDVNLDQFSDSDDIVFADSDEEEGKEVKKKEKKDSKLIITPFWFGNEDEEQLRHINSNYYRLLKLGEEKKRLIRQPKPFVGRISRIKVDNGEIFTTLDVVEVYRRSLLPPGSIMPLIRKVQILTCWSYEDGLPTNFTL